MLDICLELAQVNHRKCVEVLLPLLVEHCAAKANPNELDRFLAKLGPNAAPAACELLDEMDADSKDRLIVWLVAAHEERLRDSADRHLAELFDAPIIQVGHFSAIDRPGSQLALMATQVRIDYPALLHSSLVEDGIDQIGRENGVLKSAAKLALQMGMHMSPENLEKQGILLLNSAKVKSRLMVVLQDAVCQAGLDVTLSDMKVSQSAPGTPPGQLAGSPLPEDFANEWMDALAAKVDKLSGLC